VAGPLKISGKLGENAQSLSFLKSGLTPKFGEKISSHRSPEKSPSFTAPAVNIHEMAKKKIKKNITGLRNQSKLTSHVEERHACKMLSSLPLGNDNCCMARLLSKQDDFTNQVSMLETLIKEAGHECIIPPKC